MSELSADQHALLDRRFELLEFLGSGGFGQVYRARDDQREGAEVAVKVLTRVGPRALSRFKEEFRAVRDIVHDSLVTYYELGSIEDLWFITMDYVDGVDVLDYVLPDDRRGREDSTAEDVGALWTTIRETKVTDKIAEWDSPSEEAASTDLEIPTTAVEPVDDPLPDLDRLREVLIQIAHGLEALHGADKLHCDLKPENILVEPDGAVTILDFGLVRDLMDPSGLGERSDPQTSPHSSPGESLFIGTPHYASPEHVRGEWLDEATDWYSVGVLMYRMLAGQFPFEGSSDTDVLARKQLFEPVDLRELRPDLPSSLSRLCMDLLAPSPEARPRAAEVFRRLGTPVSPEEFADGGRAEVPDQFVGRTRAVNSLSTVVEATIESGGTGLIEVTGRSGMGKTALCRHYLWNVRRRYTDARVLSAECHDDESVPFKALDGIVDRLVEWFQHNPVGVPDLADETLRSLARLFPVARQLLSDDDAEPSTDGTSRSAAEVRRLAADALRDLFRSMARTGPVFVFVDDVHWGDTDSGQLLSTLLSEPAPPILLLMTSRAGPDRRGPVLEILDSQQTHLAPDLHRVHLSLDPLEDREAEALAEALLDQFPESESLAARIARESDGHPFLIAEMARWANAHQPSGTLPGQQRSLDAILGERIGDLSDRARRLLEVLAVTGRPTRTSTARRVAQLDGAELQTAITELRTERLLRQTVDEGKLATYHDQVRETVLAGLSPERRRTIHRALASTLRERDDVPPEWLVDHLAGAGATERAARYARSAADRARQAYAYSRAAELYDRALQYREWPEAEHLALLRHRAAALSGIGRNREAAEVFGRACDLADGWDRLELRCRRGDELVRTGMLEEGIPLLIETLRELGVSIPDPDSRWIKVRFLWQRARLAWRGFDYELRPPEELSRREDLILDALGALAAVASAMDLSLASYCQHVFCYRALEAGVPGPIAAALCLQSGQEMIRETTRDRARQMIDEAESLIAHSERQSELRHLHAFEVGMVHHYSGEFQQANTWYQRALELLPVESQQAHWERDTYRLLSLFPDHWLGRFERFTADFEAMLERARSVGNQFHESLVLTWSYFDRLCDDAPGEAFEYLEAADDRWEAPNYHTIDLWILQGRVETHLYAGEAEEALELLRDDAGPLQRSMMLQVEFVRLTWELLRGRTLLALAADATGFRRWWLTFKASRAADRIADISTDFLSVFALPLRARLADLDGRIDEALEQLREAEAIFDRYDIRFYAAALRRRRGELLGGQEGRDLLERADAEIRNCGVAAPAEMARMANASTGGEDRERPTLEA